MYVCDSVYMYVCDNVYMYVCVVCVVHKLHDIIQIDQQHNVVLTRLAVSEYMYTWACSDPPVLKTFLKTHTQTTYLY